jgi:hypothetical protein
VNDALPAAATGKPLEIWFQDEARVGQKGWLPYIWAPVGSRPPAVRDNRHDSVYLFGAICPGRGVGAAIIMPVANTEAMNQHLKEISTQVRRGAHGGFKRSSQHDPLLVYRSTPVTDPTGSQLSVMLWCGGPTWKG